MDIADRGLGLDRLVLPVQDHPAINLIMVYPRWHVDGAKIFSFIPLAVLLAVLRHTVDLSEKLGSGPLAALGCFVIVLVPVLGFVDMSFIALLPGV